MSQNNIETIKLFELKPGSPFRFNNDRTRTIYWFKHIDGNHGQIFSSLKDMNKFNNPSFVDGYTLIQKIKVIS